MKKIIVGINCATLLFSFISFFTPWLSFTSNTPSQRVYNQLVPGSENSGSLYLYQSIGCTKVIDGPSTGVQKSCTLIELVYLPDSLSYIYSSSNVVLVFMSLSLPFQIVSIIVSYFKAIDGEVGFPWLDQKYSLITLNGIAWIFHIIAFGTYSGQIGTKFNINTDGTILGFNGTQNRFWSFGGGFGLCVVSSILTMIGVYLDMRFGLNNLQFVPPYLPPKANETKPTILHTKNIYRPYAEQTVKAVPVAIPESNTA